MSAVWEFALTRKRLAIAAACVGVAGIVLAAASFEAGVILAPKLRSDLALVTKTRPTEAGPLALVRKPGRIAHTDPAGTPQPAKESSVVAPIPTKGGTPAPIPGATGNLPPTRAAEQLPIQLEVRVASFASDDKARSTVTQLKDSGYPATDVPWRDARNQEWHAVEVGPYAAHEAASRTVLELSTKYGFSPVIVASRVH